MSRTIPGDWFAGSIPDNVVLDETAYLETAYYFSEYRSEAGVGMRIGRGASAYGGTMFDVGRRGQVNVGDFSLLGGDGRLLFDFLGYHPDGFLSSSLLFGGSPKMPRAFRPSNLPKMGLPSACAPHSPGKQHLDRLRIVCFAWRNDWRRFRCRGPGRGT